MRGWPPKASWLRHWNYWMSGAEMRFVDRGTKAKRDKKYESRQLKIEEERKGERGWMNDWMNERKRYRWNEERNDGYTVNRERNDSLTEWNNQNKCSGMKNIKIRTRAWQRIPQQLPSFQSEPNSNQSDSNLIADLFSATRSYTAISKQRQTEECWWSRHGSFGLDSPSIKRLEKVIYMVMAGRVGTGIGNPCHQTFERTMSSFSGIVRNSKDYIEIGEFL